MRTLPFVLVLAGCPWIAEDDEKARYDLDGDGLPWFDDCDPDDGEVGPKVEWYADQDGDGWGDALATQVSCPPAPAGFVGQPGDCWDADESVHPDAAEVCDNYVDDNCNELHDQCVLSGVLEMPDGATATQHGSTSAGYFGVALDIGHLNTDGIADIAIGALGESGTVDRSGRVHLFHGPISEAWNEPAPAVLSGEFQNGEFGASVLLPGDLYGKGGGSAVVVGAPREAVFGAASVGRVYLFDTAPASATSTTTKTARGVIDGQGAPSLFGWALATLGDASGDGKPDFAVAAPMRDVPVVRAGAVYLFHGPVEGSVTAATAAATLQGNAEYAYAGNALANVGDTDGDGVAELLVGVPGGTCGDGPAGGFATLVPVTVTGNVTLPLEGAATLCGDGGGFATSVAGLGDVDGDGLADLAVAAPLHDANGLAAAGVVYVYRGPFSGLVPTGAAAAIIGGTHLEGGFGRQLAGLPDLDWDGVPELAASEPWTEAGAGNLLVFPGDLTGEVSLDSASLQFRGVAIHAAHGLTPVEGGDLDDDGYLDVLIGAPGDAAVTTLAGAVHFIRGTGM